MLSLRDFLFIYSLPFFHSGSSFTKKCLAFVPKTGQSVDPIWYVRDFKASNKTSERIYVSEKRSAHSSCLLTFLFTCFDKLTVWGVVPGGVMPLQGCWLKGCWFSRNWGKTISTSTTLVWCRAPESNPRRILLWFQPVRGTFCSCLLASCVCGVTFSELSLGMTWAQNGKSLHIWIFRVRRMAHTPNWFPLHL